MTSVPQQQVETGNTPGSSGSTRRVVVVGFGVLCLSYMLNAMDRQIFYPLLPDISGEFGFSLEQGGTLATGFTLGLAAAGLLGGFLVDRLSRRNILVIAVLMYSAGTVGVPLAGGFVDMSAYRLLSGIGEGIHAAALYAVVGAFFFHRRAVAAGVVGVSFGLGIFLGPLVGTQIVSAWGDWRGPFYVFAAIGVVMSLLIVVSVSKRLTEAVGTPGAASQSYDHVPANPLNRNTVGLGVACVVSGLVFYGFLGLYPTFLAKELGFSAGEAAFALSMAGFGAMMALPAGWLGDRYDQRMLLAVGFAGAAGCTFLAYQVVTSPAAHYVLAFLIGTFASGVLFTNCTTAMQRAVRPEHVGRGAGMFMLTYYVGAAFSGLIFAWLVGRLGWQGAGLWQLTLLPVLGIAALSVVRTSRMLVPYASPKK
ncbi:MFS transporter [Streptomyces sp. WMMB 322]|uniref:MFS transporter n=1 Tax=Streptomyces sp. WMMB 322 TaxID=1286821 RepID=UPI0006E1593C|nr:MFS transporter [Streptomyces sp. WMMB 322]SCK13075.1 Sugar phosphate permease [Streptomyces sp. WMMB 322]